MMSTIVSVVGSRVASRIRNSNGQFLSPQPFRRPRCLCSQVDKSPNVQHDTAKNEFYLKKGNDRAVLKYKVLSPKLVELEHTEVPDAFRGQGIARILAEAAFKYVVQHDLQMKISCEYLQDFVRKYPKAEYLKRMV